jgi:hypothetical protein
MKICTLSAHEACVASQMELTLTGPAASGSVDCGTSASISLGVRNTYHLLCCDFAQPVECTRRVAHGNADFGDYTCNNNSLSLGARSVGQ